MGVQQEEYELIDRILEGDEASYKILVDKYKKYAFSLSLRILNNREDAEEASMDAFVKAFHSLKGFNRNSKFSTWLYRIVFNTSLTYKKKQKLNQSIDDTYLGETLESEETDELQEKDQRKFIMQALKELLPMDATILSLFYLKENTLEEIGEVVGMNPNSVKVKLFRARKRLADELTKNLSHEAIALIK